MDAALTHSLANEAIIAMAGPEAFARAQVYVREGHVTGLEFDADRRIVSGRVRGSHHATYASSVELAGAAGSQPSLLSHHGRCSCPVGVDCKHAAAVLIAARGLPAVVSQLNRPEWERSLARLAAAEPVREPEPLRLGLEFDLEQSPGYGGAVGPLHLRVRPVRWGSSSRWVRSGIGWDQLDYLASGYRSEQRDLLLQLWASAGATARFGYPRSPWLALTAISPSLWSVLDRAGRSGLGLVTAAGTEDLLVRSGDVRVGLDLGADAEGGVDLKPVVLVDSRPVQAGRVGTLGEPAHGIFWLTVPEQLRQRPSLVLAPLARPLAGELRTLLSHGTCIHVPAADRTYFLDEVVPTIRPAAALVCSDRSIDLPEPVPPRLVCAVDYRPEHRLRLDWSFSYAGDEPDEPALDEPILPPTRRDREAEGALLAGLQLPYERIPALRAPAGHGPAAHALLAGRDTVVFATEVLPSLTAAGVEIRTTGNPVDYRESTGAPRIELSTADRPPSPGPRRPGGADWFDLDIRVLVDGDPLDFGQLFVALSLGDEFMITDDGVCVDLGRSEFTTLKELIAEARGLRESDTPGLRIGLAQASVWDELLALGVVVGQSERWSRSVRDLLRTEPADPVAPPDSLKAELRPYQRDGFAWLLTRYRHDLGAILADDMGLGKTLQTLALICQARAEQPDEPPFLVVAPTSVTTTWIREAERFAPNLQVLSLDGTAAHRRETLAELDGARRGGVDLVITSYALARIDVAELTARPWRGLVLDEAQFVKNHRSKTYQSVRQIDAAFKLAITGTPLENNLMELWSLLSITAPGLFPHPERFSETYRLPIERGTDRAALDRLRRRIRPLMLRRTKESVAPDLPPKQEQVLDVVLAPRHQRVYQTHLQRERQKVLGLVEDLDKNRFTILRSITLLRQLALDPSLVDVEYEGVPASKIDILLEQVQELVAEGHRALVFSQFTGFLRRVRARLSEAGVASSYLDGSTEDRDSAIDAFSSGSVPVFLISLKAGGFGLNLTAADYCFVLDPWWNPAAEAQAVDRAHRIGQSRPVMVYRLVARGTIEEKVMELKARKERLVGSILGDELLGDASLSVDEIRELLAG